MIVEELQLVVGIINVLIITTHEQEEANTVLFLLPSITKPKVTFPATVTSS